MGFLPVCLSCSAAFHPAAAPAAVYRCLCQCSYCPLLLLTLLSVIKLRLHQPETMNHLVMRLHWESFSCLSKLAITCRLAAAAAAAAVAAVAAVAAGNTLICCCCCCYCYISHTCEDYTVKQCITYLYIILNAVGSPHTACSSWHPPALLLLLLLGLLTWTHGGMLSVCCLQLQVLLTMTAAGAIGAHCCPSCCCLHPCPLYMRLAQSYMLLVLAWVLAV